MSKKVFTFEEAAEKSWPQGQMLVELMEKASGVKKEPTALSALRLSIDRVDTQIRALQIQREKMDGQLQQTCKHPLERLIIIETIAEYAVVCKTCSQEVLRRRRGE